MSCFYDYVQRYYSFLPKYEPVRRVLYENSPARQSRNIPHEYRGNEFMHCGDLQTESSWEKILAIHITWHDIKLYYTLHYTLLAATAPPTPRTTTTARPIVSLLRTKPRSKLQEPDDPRWEVFIPRFSLERSKYEYFINRLEFWEIK